MIEPVFNPCLLIVWPLECRTFRKTKNIWPTTETPIMVRLLMNNPNVVCLLMNRPNVVCILMSNPKKA
jgi:hypothetical protein